MKIFKVNTTLEITQEQVDDIVATALEGGITYWCDSAYAEPVINNKYASEMLSLGSTIKLHNSEDNEWYDLTLNDLLKSLGDTKFDFNNYDSLDVDQVVQKAIFGEVVYG